MLTNRCSEKLCRILKEHGFPQCSIEFDSDYYNELGNLVYGVNILDEKSNLVFAPYICEVIDRFELDLDIYISAEYSTSGNGWQYRIYDPSENVEITSDLSGIELSTKAYELGILKAIEYYDKKIKRAGTEAREEQKE